MKVSKFLEYLKEDCEEYGDYDICLTKVVVMTPETYEGDTLTYESDDPYEVVLDLPIGGYAFNNDSKEFRFLLTDKDPTELASYIGKEIRRIDE